MNKYPERNIVRIIFSFLLVGISLPIFSQSQVVMQQTIKDQATTMLEAFEDHNYNKLLDYTYPKIFELSGGKATMLEIIQESMQELELAGYIVDSANIGEPGPIYNAGVELHAIISQFVYMTIPGGSMMNESPLLAVSDNNGVSWYFLDTKQLNSNLKAYFFPNFNEDLKIPEPKPVIYDYEKKK